MDEAEHGAEDADGRRVAAGGLEDRLVVTLDPDRLADAGESSQQIVDEIASLPAPTVPGTM